MTRAALGQQYVLSTFNTEQLRDIHTLAYREPRPEPKAPPYDPPPLMTLP